MTEADPDAIGPNSAVRLPCYLPTANSVRFSGGCEDLAGFGHAGPISLRVGDPAYGSEATVRLEVVPPDIGLLREKVRAR